MRDVVFLGIVIAFFGICIAYVRACDALIRRAQPEPIPVDEAFVPASDARDGNGSGRISEVTVR